MSEKGTLCHAATRSETCEGVSPPKWADMGGGEGGRGGRKPLVCFGVEILCFPV